jgi:hypothetical protein
MISSQRTSRWVARGEQFQHDAEDEGGQRVTQRLQRGVLLGPVQAVQLCIDALVPPDRRTSDAGQILQAQADLPAPLIEPSGVIAKVRSVPDGPLMPLPTPTRQTRLPDQHQTRSRIWVSPRNVETSP